jgi:hypothetical protein
VWARIVSGVIAEYPVIVRDGETPDQCYAPAFVAECVTVPSGTAPAVGWTYANGVFSEPVVSQKAPIRAQLAGGLNLTSTATPALNGVYAIDEAAQSNIGVEAQFISAFAEFTNGATTDLQWQRLDGSWVTFPAQSDFLAFAKAAGQLVAKAKLATAQGNALPAATATIP